MGEWVHALRGLGGNPLWRYLARPPRRGWQRWCNVALAILLGALLPVATIIGYAYDLPYMVSVHMPSRGPLDVVLCAVCDLLILFAFVTLAVSLFLVTGDALGVLAAPGRRLSRQQLDDAVALTSLRPCEIVVAVVATNLRRLFWPILALSFFVGVVHCASAAGLAWIHGLPGPFGILSLVGPVALVPLSTAGTFGCGMLAATLLILAMLALGRGVRSGIVLTAAGVGQVVGQVLYVCLAPMIPLMAALEMPYLLAPNNPAYTQTLLLTSGGFPPALAATLLTAVALAALLGLARWSVTLRAALAACWQLLAGIPFLAQALSGWPPSLFGLARLIYSPAVLKPGFVNSAQVWGLTLPLNLFAVPHGGALGLPIDDPLHIPYLEWYRWPLLVAAQLALIAFAAAQARSAVVLRFRGQ